MQKIFFCAIHGYHLHAVNPQYSTLSLWHPRNPPNAIFMSQWLSLRPIHAWQVCPIWDDLSNCHSMARHSAKVTVSSQCSSASRVLLWKWLVSSIPWKVQPRPGTYLSLPVLLAIGFPEKRPSGHLWRASTDVERFHTHTHTHTNTLQYRCFACDISQKRSFDASLTSPYQRNDTVPTQNHHLKMFFLNHKWATLKTVKVHHFFTWHATLLHWPGLQYKQIGTTSIKTLPGPLGGQLRTVADGKTASSNHTTRLWTRTLLWAYNEDTRNNIAQEHTLSATHPIVTLVVAVLLLFSLLWANLGALFLCYKCSPQMVAVRSSKTAKTCGFTLPKPKSLHGLMSRDSVCCRFPCSQ